MDASVVMKCTDDNWGKLYQAILDFNEPPSVVCNTLKFSEDIPELAESSGGVLMPPLSDHFNWSVSLPAFSSETPITQLGITPVNTAAPSPWTEDDNVAADCGESLQPTWDIYSGFPAPGSDAVTFWPKRQLARAISSLTTMRALDFPISIR